MLVSGADYIASLTGLDSALDRADLLITGEGRFDAQSLTGKVVGQALAKASGRTLIIAGELTAPAPDLGWSLTELAGRDAAMTDPARWIREAASLAAQRYDPAARLSG